MESRDPGFAGVVVARLLQIRRAGKPNGQYGSRSMFALWKEAGA